MTKTIIIDLSVIDIFEAFQINPKSAMSEMDSKTSETNVFFSFIDKKFPQLVYKKKIW